MQRESEWINLNDGPAVRIYPRGGLKLVRFSGLDSWTSILPGLFGIVGLISNKLIFRGRWMVELRTSAHTDAVGEDGARFIVDDRAEAEQCLVEVTAWLRSHPTLAGFTPRTGSRA